MPAATAYFTIHALAIDQFGVFSAEQARAAGVTPAALFEMVKRERLQKVAFGLYRDPAVPESRLTPYSTAVLWPHGTTGVLSHETALALMELSDTNPAAIHITVPKAHRPRRRQPPPGVVLHRADLGEDEVGSVDGLPVTTAARTLRDCAAAGVGPALLRQALADARRTGWIQPDQADALAAELMAAGTL